MLFLEIVFYIFIIVVFIQVSFYIFIFRKFTFLKKSKVSRKNIAISVIVCAKNEAENLNNFIPSILQQDYLNFEVILINDASNDETLNIIKDFETKYKNIKVVDVKNNEAFWANKKYALTLGIKAASNNFLLFTDADCKPVSRNWITEMSSQFTNTKTIVLGYGAYNKVKNSLLNKLIRFETLITAIQYFSYAKIGLPYMGIGRNLAYTKQEFFNANGFMSHIKIRSGDDDLFINQIATKKNTAICFSEDSFTTSIPKKSFKNWYKQKRRHITTANNYKPLHKFLLALFYSSQLLFWTLSLLLIITLYKWKVVIFLVSIRLLIQGIIFGFSAKKLKENDLIILLPFLEFFLVLIQIVIFINNLISKPNYWK
jgi:glycosyltransferase involved in cell wall biosynthesis